MQRNHPASTRVSALRRVIGGLITAVAVTAAAVLTGAATAQAEPSPVNDSFENSPATRWRLWTTGRALAAFSDTTTPRSGAVAAYLLPLADWASVERSVTLDPASGFRTCDASVYVAKSFSPGGTVYLQIIDAATWTYITATTAVAPSHLDGYRQVKFAKFARTTATMVFRIGFENNKGGLIVDDFSISCSNPLQ